MNKCKGCGVVLQVENKNELGYTPKITNDYCERCFKLIHYNENKLTKEIDNSKIIAKANKLNYFTIFLTELFSLNEDLIELFNKIKNRKILVLNKSDLIPKNINEDNLIRNIKEVYNIDCDVYLISVNEQTNINKITNVIERENNVILIGETSSGKSSLINLLIGSGLTVSKYQNTTLDFIKLKYNDYLIYDSPGLLINKEKEYINKIKVYTKKISEEYILEINNLKIKGEGNITIFISDKENIHSKKDSGNLEYNYDLEKNDIVLDKGFIYVNKKTKIYSNQKLEIRESIISK